MIVEQRDYHVFTGKLRELVRLYETEGIALQQEHLGRLVGAFTTDVGALSTYTSLWAYESYAEREERRATGCRPTSAGSLPREDPAADPHAAEPDPDSDPVLADPLMGRSTARSRSSPAARRGSGARSPKGSPREGARIVVADLAGAEEAAAAYDGGVGLTVDVASEEDMQRLADEVRERCGRIDVLVNNAGLYASLEMRPFEQIPLEEWRQVMDVNVASMFLTAARSCR